MKSEKLIAKYIVNNRIKDYFFVLKGIRGLDPTVIDINNSNNQRIKLFLFVLNENSNEYNFLTRSNT